ncbi:MAG: hypothetical protein Kow0063_32360 [Anaerolineae bacterium]
MTRSRPTLNEWRGLYQAAIRVKEVAPWDWMTETDIFGVRDPETGETGFVSVMGALGEHLAVAVYLGSEGLYGFWAFQQFADSAPSEVLLDIPHLQASFEDRSTLSAKDRDMIKELGLKFRGRQSWPMFRSYRPGFFPWYLEASEARLLTYALEQAIEVALRFKEDPAILDTSDDTSYMVRVGHKQGDAFVWQDRLENVPPPESRTISVPMDLDMLEAVSQLPHSRQVLEIDFFTLPTGVVEEKGARPYFPHMLLVVDSGSGFVFSSELLSPEADLAMMWAQIPVTLVYQLARIGAVPRQIRVRSQILAQWLQLLVEELGFQVKVTRRLPALDEAKDFLMRRFM